MEKSLAKNSILYLIYNVLNVIFPFFTGIYVARILLPTDIGQVETARNLAQYFVIFSFLGIPTYGLREISKARNNQYELNKLYSELMIINTISTFVFLILYNLVIFMVPVYRNRIEVFMITGISIALNLLNNTWLFEGLEKFDYISIRNFIFKLLSFVLLLIFVRDNGDYLIYALITVIGTAGNYLLNILSSRKYVKFSFDNIDLKRHMKSIMYLVVVNLAIEIYSMVDITMLGLMCKKEVVTYYSYGMKIQKILLQVINTFTMVLVPRIALYYKNNKIKDFNNLVTKALAVILILALPIILGTYFLGTSVLVKLYGKNYIRSANVLKILSLAIIISPIGYLLGSRILLVTGKENKMIYAVGVGAIVNIIGNGFMIPLYEETGAAIASIVSELIVAIVYIILANKYFSLDYKLLKTTIYKVIFSLLIMLGVLLVFNHFDTNSYSILFLQILACVVVYFSILLITRENIIYAYFDKVKNRIIAIKYKDKD